MLGERNKESIIAVFDIASASVGGLVFKQKKNNLPEIITSARSPANFSKEISAVDLRRNMRNAIASVAGHLKKFSREYYSVLCVFSSPWYVSRSKIIKVQREKPFEINEDLFEKLIKGEMAALKKEWRSAPAEEDTFLEHAPIKTVLNGYTIRNPIGKKASKLELYTYLSMAEHLIRKKIKEDISSQTNTNLIYMHSFPFVLFKVLERIITTEEGFIFIDISGEITDVFIIRNNAIEEVSSFPKGENFLIRKLASAFNLNLNEARARLSQYQREEIEGSYTREIEGVLSAAGNEWGKYLKDLLKEIAKDKNLPQTLYFCGPAVSLKEINSQVGKPFRARFLLPDSLKYHFDFEKRFSDNKDIFLLISCLFANNFLTRK